MKNFAKINLVLLVFFFYVQFMIAWKEYRKFTLEQKINFLYEHGTFVMAIRYYGYKVNLYLLGSYYVEVFVNHKNTLIEKILPLDVRHSRMKFYSDQISLPCDILS